MITTRAKFVCQTETRHGWSADVRTYRFAAQHDTDTPEDRRYAKATPSGSLEITVDKPEVTFELGKAYYLDFTPVDEA